MRTQTYSSPKRLQNAFHDHTEHTITNELLLMWMKVRDEDTIGVSSKYPNTLVLKQKADIGLCLKYIRVSFEQLEFIKNNLHNQYITQYPIWSDVLVAQLKPDYH